MLFILGIKLVAPKKYNEKFISMIKKYISFYKIIFWLAKPNYSNDTTKVLYILQFLIREIKRT